MELGDGEVLIPIAINIPIELSQASPVSPKSLAMEHLPLNNTTFIQHPIDLLSMKLEKNVTANNDFKNFIDKFKNFIGQ